MADETVPVDVVPALRAFKYNGANSAQIAAQIADFTVTSEDATTLSFTSGGAPWTVARNGYIAYAGGAVTAVYNNEDDYQDALTAVSVVDHIHELVWRTGGALPAPEEY